MRVGPATNVARINVTETITALWTFAHANGISLNNIIERTPATGVTIDGVTLQDKTVNSHSHALASGRAFLASVLGDGVERFLVQADGQEQWGDGVLARDTNLYRDAPNVLKTDDSLEVAGVLGVVVDDITERTPNLGVMIDSVLLKDKAVDLRDHAAAGDGIMHANVVGDADTRYQVNADGEITWGDGVLARDTMLRREAADELGTPDDFNVGGVLDLAGDIEFSSRDALLALGNNDDVPTGTATVQRITRNAGGSDITGFAGGREGRMIIVVNLGPGGMSIFHDDAGSVAANRVYNPDGVVVVLGTVEQVSYFYDSTTQRWRLFGNGT